MAQYPPKILEPIRLHLSFSGREKLSLRFHTLALASKGRVGDIAIKNAAGSKYMSGGVLNWAPAIPQ